MLLLYYKSQLTSEKKAEYEHTVLNSDQGGHHVVLACQGGADDATVSSTSII